MLRTRICACPRMQHTVLLMTTSNCSAVCLLMSRFGHPRRLRHGAQPGRSACGALHNGVVLRQPRPRLKGASDSKDGLRPRHSSSLTQRPHLLVFRPSVRLKNRLWPCRDPLSIAFVLSGDQSLS